MNVINNFVSPNNFNFKGNVEIKKESNGRQSVQDRLSEGISNEGCAKKIVQESYDNICTYLSGEEVPGNFTIDVQNVKTESGKKVKVLNVEQNDMKVARVPLSIDGLPFIPSYAIVRNEYCGLKPQMENGKPFDIEREIN